MSKIIKNIDQEVVKKTAERCKKHGHHHSNICTNEQSGNNYQQSIMAKLPAVGLWDLNPANLYRITWKNDTKTGLFGGVNYFEVPKTITGVDAQHYRHHWKIFSNRCT